MNTQKILFALLEWSIDLVIGVLVLYLVYRLFVLWFKRRFDLSEHHTAFLVLLSAALFSVGYTISASFEPLFSVFKLLKAEGLSGKVFVSESAKYSLIFIVLGLMISFASSFITLTFYNLVTKHVNELKEIAGGHTGYAVFMGTIIIVIAVFTRDAYVNLLEALIPYPHIPVIPR